VNPVGDGLPDFIQIKNNKYKTLTSQQLEQVKMTSRDFCYWLQGYFEVSGAKEIGPEETEQIKKHLSLAFVHDIDPSHGDQAEQDKLNAIHSAPFNEPNLI